MNCDFFVQTDTCLTPSLDDNELYPYFGNFNIFRHDRNDRSGSGVWIASRNDLRCCRVSFSSPLEVVWICCRDFCASVLIGVCSLAFVNNPTFVSNLNDYLVLLKKKCCNEKLISFGNFNFPASLGLLVLLQPHLNVISSTCI